MESAVINNRTGGDPKRQSVPACSDVCPDVPVAVPNAVTKEAIEDAGNGVGMSRAFSSAKELMDDLDAGD